MNQPIPILLYHSVSQPRGTEFDPWCMIPEQFDEQMAFLASEGYQSLSVRDLMHYKDQAKPLPNKSVVITFDDGLKDFHTNALAILKKYNLSATLFIAVACIGKTSKWLEREGDGDREMASWDEIVEIHQSGIECASHTMTHPELDVLSFDKIKAELFDSKRILEDQLAIEVENIAYPHGYYNKTVQKIAKQAGYRSGCAVKNAMSYDNDDMFALARIDVRNHVTVELLQSYLESNIIPLASKQESYKTKVWRFARRFGLNRLTVLNSFLDFQQRQKNKQLYG